MTENVSSRPYGRYATREAYENSLRLSREAKRRRRGVCRECGGETRYNGRAGKTVSNVCDACNHRPWTHCANGHELTPDVDLRSQKGNWTCRICRNEYQREFSRRQRRAAGKPERDLSLYESRRLKLA